MDGFLERVGGWDPQLETKPDFVDCMRRVYAWFEGEILDRPPVRFSRHNAEYEAAGKSGVWKSEKERWFDVESQLSIFEAELSKKRFLGETFPVFWPNLGPNVFAGCYGAPISFADVTSWASPVILSYEGDWVPRMDWGSEYLLKLDEMTDAALSRCRNKYLVGYTDLHPGLDWCAAMRGTEELMMDTIDDMDNLVRLEQSCREDFFAFYDHFDRKLKESGQLSVTWMNIPSYQKLHIPSCDASSMLSTDAFREAALPGLAAECGHMDHNIFHVDGKGVARHIDDILRLPKLCATQWVQGVGEDKPIMQWLPLIKKIQAAGKGVVVDLSLSELDAFIGAMSPKGLYLCIETASEEEEREALKRIEKW